MCIFIMVIRISEELNKLEIHYEITDIDPQYSDTKEFCEKYSVNPENVINSLLITSKGATPKYAMPVIQATRRIDVNHKLKNLTGFKRLSFADSEKTKNITGMELGAVTPFGLQDMDICLYVDKPIMNLDYIILGGGVRSKKVKTTPDIFKKIQYSSIVDISQ